MLNNSRPEFPSTTGNDVGFVFPDITETISSKRGIGRSILTDNVPLSWLGYFLLANRRTNADIARRKTAGNRDITGFALRKSRV